MALRTAVVPTSHPDAQKMLASFFAEIRARLHFNAASQTAADEMDPPGGRFLVAYEDERPVACGGFRTWEPGVCEIKRMYVTPEGRRKGYGRSLLVALEHAAREASFRRIVLNTQGELLEANTLYEGSGYQRVPAYTENPYATAWFAKDL